MTQEKLKQLEQKFDALFSDPNLLTDFNNFLIKSKEGRIKTLSQALYRTREQRDMWEAKYKSEKERGDRYRERVRQLRTELHHLKNKES